MKEIIIPREIQELMASLMTPRVTRWRYFEGPRGELYCWNTERLPNGKFACWTYQPYGKGSRSGNPTRWRIRNRVEFARRKVAKARAFKRLRQAQAKYK